MNSLPPQNSSKLQSYPLTVDDALISDTEMEASLPAAISPRLAATQRTASPRAPSSPAASEQDTLEAPDAAAHSAHTARAWVVSFAPGTKTGSPAGSAVLPQRATDLPAQTLPRTDLQCRTSPPRPAHSASSPKALSSSPSLAPPASLLSPALPHSVSPSDNACMQWVCEGLSTHAGEAPYKALKSPQINRALLLAASAVAGTLAAAVLGATIGLGIGTIAAVAGLGLTGFFKAVAAGLCIGGGVGCIAGIIYGMCGQEVASLAPSETDTATQSSTQSPQHSPGRAEEYQEI
jgi:hypothetical protein